MDYIHDLCKLIGPGKIIPNCAGALIGREDKPLYLRRTDSRKSRIAAPDAYCRGVLYPLPPENLYGGNLP